MKRLLIFLILILGAESVAFQPVSLQEYRDQPISVTIDGEVEHPGTYKLERYSTVDELLEQAGLTDEADCSAVNAEITLKDHDTLTIPPKQPEKKISINTAPLQELCCLPGIGETTAMKIISYRETNGLFSELTDLLRVPGIGPKKFEQLKDRICL